MPQSSIEVVSVEEKKIDNIERDTIMSGCELSCKKYLESLHV